MKLIDHDGEDIYPTMSAAEIDRNTAIRLFGAENVSQLYDRGNNVNYDYVFNVHAPKSVDAKHSVNAIISCTQDLLRYEFFGAPRRNVVSGTLSLGAQISARYIDINLSSVNLIDFSYDIDYHNVNAQTIKEGYANGSTGFKVLFAGFKQNYVGGEYINFNSVTNIVSCGPVSVNLSNGDVEYGVSAAAIFGLSFKITSQIIKK